MNKYVTNDMCESLLSNDFSTKLKSKILSPGSHESTTECNENHSYDDTEE